MTAISSPRCTVTLPSWSGKFRDRNDAFGLVADVHDHILRRDLQHRAGNDLLFVQRGFGLGLFLLEGFQSGGEIFHGRVLFRSAAGLRRGRSAGCGAGLGCVLGLRLLGS